MRPMIRTPRCFSFRSEEDRAELIAVLLMELCAVATHHEPQNIADKELEFVYAQPGMIGLETAFSLVMNLVREGQVPRTKAIAALTQGPADVLGIEAGRLEVGGRADITIGAPDREWRVSRENLRSRSYNTPFLNQNLIGKVTHTLVAGQLKYALDN